MLAAIERVCASQHFILGADVEALEKELAEFTGVMSAVGCASGSDALWLALTAVGIGPGDEVITTALSFFASASAIVRTGARPVFVDVDSQSLNIDAVQVEKALRTRGLGQVRALLPVHLYGQCADMDSFQQLADEFKLSIVEDAAQAIGARWGRRNAGSMGAAAAFSFYPSKNLSAYGEAGMVTTNSPEYAEHMRRLRNHGSPRRYYHDEIGWNTRMDAIQAAVLRVKLPHVTEWNNRRRQHAAMYDRLFVDVGLASNSENSAVRLPFISAHAHHVFHQYVIRAQRRDELRRFLAGRNIGTEVYYPLPLHLQSCFSHLGYQEGDLPESEKASREVLALPMFPELTEEEQHWVVQGIAEFYG
ncbi:MAG: transcriptional regulator [Blastocatellia bacterium]|nr:MAG: transcriptional regulator [Blastocatellia bacterium]